MKISEVPSFESDRMFGTSNLNAISDGVRVLKTIATERRAVVPAQPTGGVTGRRWAISRVSVAAAPVAVKPVVVDLRDGVSDKRSDNVADEVLEDGLGAVV